MGHVSQDGRYERIATGPVIRDGVAFATDPTASTVVADTGAISELGTYEVTVLISSTGVARLTLQHRNTANDGNVGDTHDFLCGENNSIAFIWKFDLAAAGERFRVVIETNVTGDLSGNIVAQKVG